MSAGGPSFMNVASQTSVNTCTAAPRPAQDEDTSTRPAGVRGTPTVTGACLERRQQQPPPHAVRGWAGLGESRICEQRSVLGSKGLGLGPVLPWPREPATPPPRGYGPSRHPVVVRDERTGNTAQFGAVGGRAGAVGAGPAGLSQQAERHGQRSSAATSGEVRRVRW